MALAKQHSDGGTMRRWVSVGIRVLAGVASFDVSVAAGAEPIDPAAPRQLLPCLGSGSTRRALVWGGVSPDAIRRETRSLGVATFREFSRLLAAICAALVLCAASTGAVARGDSTVPCGAGTPGTPLSFNSQHPYTCTITFHQNSDGSEDVRIDQPVVERPYFEYKPVIFSPGDVITITADGCVQTAGLGRTWKKYVNPSGSDSGPPNGLYYGTVTIPGAIDIADSSPVAEVPLDDLSPTDTLGQPRSIVVQAFDSFPGHQVDLTLGYKDDAYLDSGGNGYWGHDNGNNDQCVNQNPAAPLGQYGGPARIDLHIVHKTPTPIGAMPYKEWDLTQSGLDANGLLSNPSWGWEANYAGVQPAGVFDPNCLPGCSQQVVTVDTPPQRLLGPLLCSDYMGHRNWFDVTYDGHVEWGGHDGGLMGDDDYNMSLRTFGPNSTPPGPYPFPDGTSSGNTGENADVLMEFDSDETIDHFDKSAIWQRYHSAVDNEPSIGSIRELIGGGLYPAHEVVATGLMGFDVVHAPYHTEVHPVHVLAIREAGPGAASTANDYWAIFVRNWGDEGYCSQNQHYLESQQVTVKLPPPAYYTQGQRGVATENLDTLFYHVGGDGTYKVYPGQGDGAYVTFDLPPANEHGYWFGELDLRWDPPMSVVHAIRLAKSRPKASVLGAARHRAWLRRLRALQARTRRRARSRPISQTRERPTVTSGQRDNDPEQVLQEAWEAMSSAQQNEARELAEVLNPPTLEPPSLRGHGELVANPPQRPATMPAVATGPATAMVLRNESTLNAGCVAVRGVLPTASGLCAAAKVPPITTLSTSGGPPIVSGWSTTPVTATLTAHDATGSGIAFTQYSFDNQSWTTYIGPFTLPDGLYTLYFRSQDNEGDLEDAREQAVKIDTKPPIISISQPANTTYTHASAVTLNYSILDGNGQLTGVGAGSGVASVGPTMDGAATLAGHGLDSGQTIHLLTELSLGPHTFTVVASDNVGHADSQSVTFTVAVTPQSLVEDIEQFYAAGAIRENKVRSLLAKLENGANHAVDGCATTGGYQAFINELRAQAGKQVDAAAASIMIGDAEYLIEHCPQRPAQLRMGEMARATDF
jgi:hypothetical protein